MLRLHIYNLVPPKLIKVFTTSRLAWCNICCTSCIMEYVGVKNFEFELQFFWFRFVVRWSSWAHKYIVEPLKGNHFSRVVQPLVFVGRGFCSCFENSETHAARWSFMLTRNFMQLVYKNIDNFVKSLFFVRDWRRGVSNDKVSYFFVYIAWGKH